MVENNISEDEFLSHSTLRRKIDVLFKKNAKYHSEEIGELEYIGNVKLCFTQITCDKGQYFHE